MSRNFEETFNNSVLKYQFRVFYTSLKGNRIRFSGRFSRMFYKSLEKQRLAHKKGLLLVTMANGFWAIGGAFTLHFH
jgi:hypothetical protein